jgi:endopeptidase Clp ATP-binding regulatory subunit ClpX
MEKIPDYKELERELNKYLEKKYGDKIRLIVSTLEPKVFIQDKTYKTERRKLPIDFDIKPEELIAYLNTFIIKQDKAKEILATKICTHYNRIKYYLSRGKEPTGLGSVKNNIILIGPTGVGKTYMVRLIAERIGVPFVKADATKFSETGYVGGDVEDLVRELVVEADGDVERAQYGIIYIDEIDKIASSGNIIGPDVSRTGVQRGLLKLMEETEVELKPSNDPLSQWEAIEQWRRTGKKQKRTINTRHILFIVSGAFNGLEEIIRRRLKKEGIGFAQEVKSKEERCEYLKHVTPEDLIEYGFESEFVGRLPVIAVLEPLGIEDLYSILKNPNNPLIVNKKRDFRAYGIEVVFEDAALWRIAELAYAQKTGARGLVSVLENVLLKFERKLPSTNIRHLLVTKELVDNPEAELERLLHKPLDENYLKRFEEALRKEKEDIKKYILSRRAEFESQYGPLFEGERVDLLVNKLLQGEDDLNSALEDLWRSYRQIRTFERVFKDRYSIDISFDQGAIDYLLKLLYTGERNPKDVFLYLESILEPALRIINERVPVPKLVIPKEGVENPETYFNELIQKLSKAEHRRPSS